MPDVTPHLGLPLIAAGQAQKHVTHNEALAQLDALVQLACLDKDLAAPPANPVEGDRYLVTASAPAGAWTGLSGQVVRYTDGVWVGLVPASGWIAYVVDETTPYVFDGRSWGRLAASSATAAASDRLGVNAQADATNRLAVKSDAVLLAWDDATPGTGDMRVTVNKKASARDAGFVFQTGYSSRALFGTLGGDDFVLKTYPDGASFTTALTAAAGSGVVSFAVPPVAPTPTAGDNSTRLATTGYVDRAVSASGGSGSGSSAATPRTDVTGSAYAIQATDRVVAVTALTAPCTLTLPSATTFPRGATLVIVDESGACSASNPITVNRSGGATVNGLTAASIATAYGYLALQSDGAGKWTVVNRTPLLNRLTFTSVSVSDGKQQVGSSFTKILLPEIKNDLGGNWDAANHWYRCPRSGIYQMSATLRVADSTAPGTQYGVGVHTTEEDGPFFLWHDVGPAPATRSTYPYSRIALMNEGDRLRLISFCDKSPAIMAAALQICLVSEAV